MNIQIKDVDFANLFGEQVATLIINKIEETLEQYSQHIRSKEWMTFKEAQEYIGVSFNTLSKMRRMGLKICEVDGVKRINKNEIDQFLKNHSF